MTSHDLSDIVDTETIAGRIGVSPQAVTQWKSRHADTFPARLPIAGVINPLYSWREVSAWHKARRTGRVVITRKRASA